MHESLRLHKPNLGGGYSKQLRSTSSDCNHHFDRGVCALALGVNEDLTRDNHGLDSEIRICRRVLTPIRRHDCCMRAHISALNALVILTDYSGADHG
jgi:hypothetical protein